jgi:hypothetical protein
VLLPPQAVRTRANVSVIAMLTLHVFITLTPLSL